MPFTTNVQNLKLYPPFLHSHHFLMLEFQHPALYIHTSTASKHIYIFCTLTLKVRQGRHVRMRKCPLVLSKSRNSKATFQSSHGVYTLVKIHNSRGEQKPSHWVCTEASVVFQSARNIDAVAVGNCISISATLPQVSSKCREMIQPEKGTDDVTMGLPRLQTFILNCRVIKWAISFAMTELFWFFWK